MHIYSEKYSLFPQLGLYMTLPHMSTKELQAFREITTKHSSHFTTPHNDNNNEKPSLYGDKHLVLRDNTSLKKYVDIITIDRCIFAFIMFHKTYNTSDRTGTYKRFSYLQIVRSLRSFVETSIRNVEMLSTVRSGVKPSRTKIIQVEHRLRAMLRTILKCDEICRVKLRYSTADVAEYGEARQRILYLLRMKGYIRHDDSDESAN